MSENKAVRRQRKEATNETVRKLNKLNSGRTHSGTQFSKYFILRYEGGVGEVFSLHLSTKSDHFFSLLNYTHIKPLFVHNGNLWGCVQPKAETNF